MKHCAKKLLGLAFALALCLAVGGTALAETPMLAAVLAALPEQEVLDYEQNVTAEPGTNSIDKLATEGYQVTIPTTVTVESGENNGTLEVKGELEVNAQLKQYRTLKIGIESTNKWKLKYQGADAGTTTPEVDYKLPQEAGSKVETDCEWQYQPTEKKLSFSTTNMKPSTSLEADMTRVRSSSYKLPITVPTPAQATMSGTYSDTLEFTFSVEKKCVTYTINAYGQKLALTGTGAHITAVNVVDASGTAESDAVPVSTVTVEYPSGGGEYTWTRTRPADDGGEDERCWEDLTYKLNPQNDFQTGETTKTINLNLERKLYWLDVNGATDYAGGSENIDGNQGARISGFVNMQVSADNGKTWSDWFWQSDGDDYWGQFPYGIHFKLGFHHVKNGYVYDTGTGTLEENGVRIIANGENIHTTGIELSKDKLTNHYVYTGTLTGEPTDKDGANVRYCYIPCYKKGLTYMVNKGDGGKEDVNEDNPPRTNVLYDENGKLENPEDLKIFPPTGKKFAGWSTKPTYTEGETLYQPGELVSKVNWENYTDTSKRPLLNGERDDEKRELYAIWGYDITVQFEDEKGYSKNNGTSIVPELGGTMSGYSFTLKGQVVADGADWTLDLTNPTVKDKIIAASDGAKSLAGDDDTKTEMALAKKIWKIGKYTDSNSHKYDFTDECTISAEELKKGNTTLTIQRRRYLLSVISTNIAGTDDVVGIATKAGKLEFGTFDVTINDGKTDLGVTQKSHCQVGLNYGAKYTVDMMTGIDLYQAMDAVILKSLKAGDEITKLFGDDAMKTGIKSYTSHMTGKEKGIHYYKDTGALKDDGYTGDPVRVAFMFYTSTTKPGSTTPMPGPSLTPAKKALTLRYHANFDPTEELALDLDPDPLLEDMDDTFGFDPDPLPEDVDDALEEAVKTVRYQPGEDVVLRNCMFKRGGYVFVGWNTEPDGTGRLYRVNGVPVTDWADGDTVDLYAQWKKPEHLKPVVDNEPFVPTDPDTPPERVDDGFDADFGADPDPLPEGMDDAFGVDPAAQPEALDDAFGIDPDPLPEELDDAFGV